MQSKSLFDRVWAHALSFAIAALTLIVEIGVLFVYFIETEGQNISVDTQIVVALIPVISGFGMAMVCFAVWRWEDRFVLAYVGEEAQRLFEIITSIMAADDSDFRDHLEFLVNGLHNRKFQAQVVERITSIDLICRGLYRIGKFELLILAVDQLKQIMDGAWQRRKFSATENSAEWLEVRDRLLAQLSLYRAQAVEAMEKQYRMSL